MLAKHQRDLMGPQLPEITVYQTSEEKVGKISKTSERAKNNLKSFRPKPTRKKKISCQSTENCYIIP